MSRWRHECLHLVIALLLASSIGQVNALKKRDSFSRAATNARTELVTTSVSSHVATGTLFVNGGAFQRVHTETSSGTIQLGCAGGESTMIGNNFSGPPQGVCQSVSA